jgi:hypothetical protein
MKLPVSRAVLERSNTTGQKLVPECVTEQTCINPTRPAGTDDGNDSQGYMLDPEDD